MKIGGNEFGFGVQSQQQGGGFNQPQQQQQGGFNYPQQQTRSQIICHGVLNEGESLCSQNQQFWLKLSQDGNLYFFNNARQSPQDIIFQTEIDFSFNSAKHPVRLEMRNDGNVALIDSNNFVYWETATSQKGQSPYMITVLNEGDCVIYDSKNQTQWSFQQHSQKEKQKKQQQKGGFNQPQQQGGFNRPQQQQGGFNHPQQQQNQGGFNQPQQQGGFNQPQQQGGFNQPQGGFNQPQLQGGFNQPQQQGGFNQPQQQTNGGFNSAFDIPKQCKQCLKQDENPFFKEKLPMLFKRTKILGFVTQGSACFDDFFGLNFQNEFHHPELSKLTVYYTDRYVVGMECTFKGMGGKSYPGACNKAYQGFGVQQATMEFGFAEHIKEISGSFDNIGFTSLKISTREASIDVGNKNIGTQFQNPLSSGFPTAIAFGGSFTTEAMQSIYLLYK